MFDPNIPATNAEATSAMFRGQFNGLKDLIDAIQTIGSATVDGVNTLPPGEAATVTLGVSGGTLHFTFGIPQGQDGSSGNDGAEGPPFAAAVVDAVNTLPAGEPATVDSTFDGSTVHLTFGIPQGQDGLPFANAVVDAVNTLPSGEPATVESTFDGSTVHLTFGIPQGADGGDGMDGPPFASAVVDSVDTLSPGDQATVESTFDGSTVHLTFGIPAGYDGASGSDGAPGEVSLQQLEDAISGSSANSNGVDTLGMVVSEPPTQAEVQQIADKLDELINALRR